MMQHKIYAYISDGAVEEEISQGVGRIAGNLGLNNLIMFYDSNDIQLSTECGVVMNEDTEMKCSMLPRRSRTALPSSSVRP
ncbi:Transketolase 1 [Segatella copri]|nr:Transketolase 1 [Segatella copri]